MGGLEDYKVLPCTIKHRIIDFIVFDLYVMTQFTKCDITFIIAIFNFCCLFKCKHNKPVLCDYMQAISFLLSIVQGLLK